METMEYEAARNLTLLFFLERLMERGEPRTLHDLSCQFGSKGFTKEMRQIAGGSQSGEYKQQQQNTFCIWALNSLRIHNINVAWMEPNRNVQFFVQCVYFVRLEIRQFINAIEMSLDMLLTNWKWQMVNKCSPYEEGFETKDYTRISKMYCVCARSYHLMVEEQERIACDKYETIHKPSLNQI